MILWFDTEDYILPASDDAALRLATWLSGQGVKATFKVVGEKARTLERRGRTDVIEALKKHEIGYHSNWHSVPPTPAQYLNECGWEDGVAEFTRREKPGFDDVARIFGCVPTCYGQPGSSWAPQTHAALRQWGVHIYLDAGQHVQVDGKPFWFGGLLNFYKLDHQLRTGLLKAQDLEEAKAKFLQSRDRLLTEGGGVVSIVYHPCEFVHRQFWDGVNFREGANPPRERWRLPPVKSAEESRLAFENFKQYVLFMKRFPEVHFVTAAEAARDYLDPARERRFTAGEIIGLCRKGLSQVGSEGISWLELGDVVLSPAEMFSLMTQVLVRDPERRERANQPLFVLTNHLVGPSQAAKPRAKPGEVADSDLRRAARDVLSFLEERKQIPSVVWIGSKEIRPEDYYWFAMRNLARQDRGGSLEGEASRAEGVRLRVQDYVAEDGPYLWKWVIFPPGFRAPAVMAMAKCQAWTLKPARFHPTR